VKLVTQRSFITEVKNEVPLLPLYVYMAWTTTLFLKGGSEAVAKRLRTTRDT
jgi:hypothetical protein